MPAADNRAAVRFRAHHGTGAAHVGIRKPSFYAGLMQFVQVQDVLAMKQFAAQDNRCLAVEDPQDSRGPQSVYFLPGFSAEPERVHSFFQGWFVAGGWNS